MKRAGYWEPQGRVGTERGANLGIREGCLEKGASELKMRDKPGEEVNQVDVSREETMFNSQEMSPNWAFKEQKLGMMAHTRPSIW